jgi:hypothetical protein
VNNCRINTDCPPAAPLNRTDGRGSLEVSLALLAQILGLDFNKSDPDSPEPPKNENFLR